MDRISLQTARQVVLAAQGLDQLPSSPADKPAVLEAVRRMAYLQIDTINVVARSPYLVLWTRLGDYRCEWLDELLAEGALFEYWAHAMCFLPIEDYPIHRRRMLDAMRDRTWPTKWAVDWSKDNPEIMERVRRHLRENGAVRSAEFENPNHQSGGWWNWKDEKNALEAMLFTGEVMIARRQNFQRVYDLRERVLPGWDDAALPSSEDVKRYLALRPAHALGIASPTWVSEYIRQPKTGLAKRLEALAGEGLLLRVEVEDMDSPMYIHKDRLALLEQAAFGRIQPDLTAVLSPFDPLVSDRARARQLFNFDYLIECFTPAAKRRYGYFSLPILHRGRLVGRLDPKAHRLAGIFEIKALHLEPGVPLDRELFADLAAAMHRLAAWHGTPEIQLRRSDPPEAAAMLEYAL